MEQLLTCVSDVRINHYIVFYYIVKLEFHYTELRHESGVECKSE